MASGSVAYRNEYGSVCKFSECTDFDVLFDDGRILTGGRNLDDPDGPPGNLPAVLPECPYIMDNIEGWENDDEDGPPMTDEEIADLPKLKTMKIPIKD